MSSRSFKCLRREGATSMYCCVPLCDTSSRFNSVVSFHTFPLDKKTSKKMDTIISDVKILISLLTQEVCSRHFKSDDWIQPSTPTGPPATEGKVQCPLCLSGTTTPLQHQGRTGTWQRREVSPPLNKDPVPVDLQHQEHDYCIFPVPAAVDLSLDQTDDLRKEVEQLRKQWKNCLSAHFAWADLLHQTMTYGSTLGKI